MNVDILHQQWHKMSNHCNHTAHVRSGQNVWVTECLLINCPSLVLQALLASSYMPIYAGLKPVEFRGQVMGSFTVLGIFTVSSVVRLSKEIDQVLPLYEFGDIPVKCSRVCISTFS